MVIVAIDSFKGSLTSREACATAREALIERGLSPDEVLAFPVSDGGEGFCDAVSEYVCAEWVSANVLSPLGETVSASYLFGNDGVAYIESASACGYCQVPADKRNPLKTSSFGLGQLIADALRRGAVKIVVGLGGTSTCDAGVGMLQALGARFILSDGSVLPNAEPALMKDVTAIETSSMTHPDGRELVAGFASGTCRFDGAGLDFGTDIFPVSEGKYRFDGAGLDFGTDIGPALDGTCRFEVWADVPAPMCGEGGTVLLYAPQKGLPDQLLPDADAWMRSVARLYDGAARACFDHVADVPGAGAAGGIGGALHAILGAEIKSGADEIIALSGLADHLAEAELVLTGEGRCDEQTLTGKLPARIAAAAISAKPCARLHGNDDPVEAPSLAATISPSICPGPSGNAPRIICLCGKNSLPDKLGPFDDVIQITPAGMPLDQALRKDQASANMRRAITDCL